MTNKINEIYFPLFWIDENFEIDQKQADTFYEKVSLKLILYDIFQYILLTIGSIIFLTCLIITSKIIMQNASQSSSEENVINNQEISENTPLIIDL